MNGEKSGWTKVSYLNVNEGPPENLLDVVYYSWNKEKLEMI